MLPTLFTDFRLRPKVFYVKFNILTQIYAD